jgi:hypothetical protein
MEECTICFYKYLNEDFFVLHCCASKLCNTCSESLTVPLCPYCRKEIPELKGNIRYKLSVSFETDFLTQSTIESLLYIEIDRPVSYTESRILRRQIRRQRKREMNEANRLRNIELSRIRNQNNSRSKKNKELRDLIKEDQDIFFFER